jgi:phosphoserine phosphatase RsbU/P
MASGDRLVFYTDGITEARNTEGDEYGEERLTEAALGVRTLSPEAMKDALLADVNAFTGGRFEDDATLIVVAIQ